MATIPTPSPLTAMPLLIPDVNVSASMIEDRRARGVDHHDEVWEGIYNMAPAPNDEHQSIAAHLVRALVEATDDPGLGQVRGTINLARDAANWENDYRVPDLAVFLSGGAAVCHGAFWTGSADLVIEIVSPYDRTREKLKFYEAVGTRELLIIDRNPWQIELLRLVEGQLIATGTSTLGRTTPLRSASTPLEFHLAPGRDRPQVVVVDAQSGRQWAC